jgi:hypothetical protein
MRKKVVTKVVLVSVVFINVSALLLVTGCAQKPEQEGGWISVEKPPIRVVYINKHQSVSPEMVHALVKQVGGFKYENYRFNDGVSISFDAHAHQSSDISNSSNVDIGKTNEK